MRSEKRSIAVIILILCLMSMLSACNRAGDNNAAQHHQPQASPSTLSRRVPAHFTEQPDLKSMAATLAPEQFTGKVRKAYQVAKEIPQTLTQLPCFCYCDTIGHKSLHSCYEDDHSAGCTVCVDSALLAAEFKQQGMSDTEIRDKLIAKYTSPVTH